MVESHSQYFDEHGCFLKEATAFLDVSTYCRFRLAEAACWGPKGANLSVSEHRVVHDTMLQSARDAAAVVRDGLLRGDLIATGCCSRIGGGIRTVIDKNFCKDLYTPAELRPFTTVQIPKPVSGVAGGTLTADVVTVLGLTTEASERFVKSCLLSGSFLFEKVKVRPRKYVSAEAAMKALGVETVVNAHRSGALHLWSVNASGVRDRLNGGIWEPSGNDDGLSSFTLAGTLSLGSIEVQFPDPFVAAASADVGSEVIKDRKSKLTEADIELIRQVSDATPVQDPVDYDWKRMDSVVKTVLTKTSYPSRGYMNAIAMEFFLYTWGECNGPSPGLINSKTKASRDQLKKEAMPKTR